MQETKYQLELRDKKLIFPLPSGLKGAGTPGGAQGTTRPGKHIQVRAGEEHMQSVEIFSQPTVNRLSEAKDILHNAVGVLYLAAYSGLAVFDSPLPVNGAVGNPG